MLCSTRLLPGKTAFASVSQAAGLGAPLLLDNPSRRLMLQGAPPSCLQAMHWKQRGPAEKAMVLPIHGTGHDASCPETLCIPAGLPPSCAAEGEPSVAPKEGGSRTWLLPLHGRWRQPGRSLRAAPSKGTGLRKQLRTSREPRLKRTSPAQSTSVRGAGCPPPSPPTPRLPASLPFTFRWEHLGEDEERPVSPCSCGRGKRHESSNGVTQHEAGRDDSLPTAPGNQKT